MSLYDNVFFFFDGLVVFFRKHKAYLLLLSASVILIIMGMVASCTREEAQEAAREASLKSNTLNVYNAGEYIDPDLIDLFEEETGIRVIYDTYETNEEMYPIIAAGGVIYDVVCPSDYMIEKMLRNDLLRELNYENIPNAVEIGEQYWNLAAQFDEGNAYAVPYTTGTVGILYNKGMLDELGIPYPTKWADLWDERLKGEILMQDSVRDAFMVALKKNGNSMNTVSDEELDQAMQDLIEQKPLVQAYVVDQARDKMIGEEAAIAVIYSGELLYIQEELADTEVELDYVVPEEGSNLWIDAWVIPKNAQNVENAEKWIDFLCRPEVALQNFEYITYSTPNVGAQELIESEILEDEAIFPDIEKILEKGEIFHYLGDIDDAKYNDRWKTVKVK